MSNLLVPTFDQDPSRLYVSERDLQEAYLHIGDQIEDSGKEFDAIVGAPRGCLAIMGVLAQRLGISANNIVTIGLTTYEDGSETAADVLKIGQMPTRGDVEGKNFLLVDDILDTGNTDVAMRGIQDDLGAASVSTAVVFYKPQKMVTGQPPEFYWKETNEWVVYPWERQGEYDKARVDIMRLGATVRDLEQLRENFISAQFPA